MKVINPSDFEIRTADSPFSESFYLPEGQPEEYKDFIKKTKATIRRSHEYTLFIAYAKANNNLRRCVFLSNIHDEMASIEIHHCPFTLHDIVEIVTETRLNEGHPISTLLIAQEVMALHFADMVGIVPVTITAHQLIHAGKLKVHMNQVFGKVSKFLEAYKSGVKKYHAGKLMAFIKYGEDHSISDMVADRFELTEESDYIDNGFNQDLIEFLLTKNLLDKETVKNENAKCFI